MFWIDSSRDIEGLRESRQIGGAYAALLQRHLSDMVQTVDDSNGGPHTTLDGVRLCVLDPQVDDARSFILADGGMWFEWAEKVELDDDVGRAVYKVCCSHDNDDFTIYWVMSGVDSALDVWLEARIER